jgi:hypothetical protein
LLLLSILVVVIIGEREKVFLLLSLERECLRMILLLSLNALVMIEYSCCYHFRENDLVVVVVIRKYSHCYFRENALSKSILVVVIGENAFSH